MVAKTRLRFLVVIAVAVLSLVAWYWSRTQLSPELREKEEIADGCEETYTSLKKAQEDFIKAGKEVCRLDLSGRRMPSLTRGVSFVTSLTWLDLSDNNFTELPQEIVALQGLKVLDLRGNPLPLEEVEKVRRLLPKTDVKF